MKVPLCIPYVGEEEADAVREVLKSRWLAEGPKTKEFEKNFADYIGVKKAVSVNSCASALHLAIQGSNLKGEIILPGFTHMASANAIVTAGCKPVFVDVDYDTCNVNPESIRKSITDKTAAIMVVHYAGHTCDMKPIMEIAEKHNLKVIEDSAETIGGEYYGKKAGTFGIGCFSFYPVKNMTTGEGGMVTTSDEELAREVSTIKGHGVSTTTFEREKLEKPWYRAAVRMGYNFRMCDINATIGLVQLKKLDTMNEMRRKNASYLNKNLIFDEIDLPVERENVKHVYQMYTIKLKESIDRTKFIMKLREIGIGASVHFNPPVHIQPFYKKYCNYKLPMSELVSERLVTLPMYPQMKKKEMDKIIISVEESLKHAKIKI